MQALLAIVEALQVPMLALHDFHRTHWYTYISAWVLHPVILSAEIGWAICPHIHASVEASRSLTEAKYESMA